MRSQRKSLIHPVSTSSAITKALLFIAKISRFSRSWRTADDWAALVSQVYGLTDELKTVLTGSVLIKGVLDDPAVKTTVREIVSGMNTTGIFCDEYRPNGSLKTWCLFIAPPGEQPPTPSYGTKWYNNLVPLPRLSLRADVSDVMVTDSDRNILIQFVESKQAKANDKKKAPQPAKENENQPENLSHHDEHDESINMRQPEKRQSTSSMNGSAKKKLKKDSAMRLDAIISRLAQFRSDNQDEVVIISLSDLAKLLQKHS